MADRRLITLQHPSGGIARRMSLQNQKPYTCVDSQNVVSDRTSDERESGGSRPGLVKSHSSLLGSGDEVRLIDTLMYQTTAYVNQNILVAAAGGNLYKEDTATTMAVVSSSLTLASDRPLQSATRDGVLYIADDGAVICKGTDGVLTGTSFTSASVGNFATAGVDVDDMLLVIVSHAGFNEVQVVTINGTPTGGVFRLRFDGQTTPPLAYNATASDVQVALRALSSINGAHVTVTGSAGGPYTCTFSGDLATTELDLMTADFTGLTGGTDPTVTIAASTLGASTTRWAGSWQMASLATTTITLSKTLRNLTGVSFHIQRAPKRYTGSTNTLSLWMTDDDDDGNPIGFIPVGRPLCVLWRDRMVLAGGKYTPHLWEMSRQGDPDDFNYGAEPDDVGKAIAGQTSDAGQLGEPITALIPHNNDCLIFGCSSSLWIMRGDPAYGGQIDNLSRKIGVLTATSWCRTPEDYLFFLGRDGLAMMAPGCGSTPVSVSREVLPKELLNIDTTAYTITMDYDVRYRAIHLCISKNSAATATHWWIDTKVTMFGDATNAAFWKVVLPNTNFDPFVSHSRRNYASDYSDVIFGCRDGYLRRYSHDADTDDGTAFVPYVIYGPVRASSDDYTDGMIHDITADVAQDSGAIKCEVLLGETAETAYASSALQPPIYWRTTGLQYPQTVRRACRNFFLKISAGTSGTAFALEGLRVTVGDKGRQRKV
jgi:hypothetical protein